MGHPELEKHGHWGVGIGGEQPTEGWVGLREIR